MVTDKLNYVQFDVVYIYIHFFLLNSLVVTYQSEVGNCSDAHLIYKRTEKPEQ